MIVKKHTGLKRVLYASYYSYKGLRHSIIHESAFRQEVIAALVLIPLACWLDVSVIERLFMIFTIFLVLIVELLNTAIEAIVDRIGVEFHDLSGLAKDVGSASVLMSLLLCVLVWVVIILQ